MWKWLCEKESKQTSSHLLPTVGGSRDKYIVHGVSCVQTFAEVRVCKWGEGGVNKDECVSGVKEE